MFSAGRETISSEERHAEHGRFEKHSPQSGMRLQPWTLFLAFAWTTVVAISLVWNDHLVRDSVLSQAYNRASAAMEKDVKLIRRKWWKRSKMKSERVRCGAEVVNGEKL